METNDITPEEMQKMLLDQPLELIQLLEKGVAKRNLDLIAIAKDMDIARGLVRSKYGMSDKDIHATEFVFWISYIAERDLRETILAVEKIVLKDTTPMMEGLLDKISFWDKINLIEKHYIAHKEFVSILRQINTLRNNVAHGRVEKLTFNEYSLGEITGQTLLISDYIKASKRQH